MNGTATTRVTLEAWLATLNLDTPHSRARLHMIRRGLRDGRAIQVESEHGVFDLQLDASEQFRLTPAREAALTISV